MLGASCRVAVADDLARGINSYGKAVRAAERAQIDHPATRRPRERVLAAFPVVCCSRRPGPRH